MISFSSCWAIVLRHFHVWKREPNLLLMGFYWPLLDIFIWGFLGAWIGQSQTSLPNYEAVALLGILLWQVVGRGCNMLGILLCEELWVQNFINLFSLPLRTAEWIVGIVLFSSMVMCLTFLMSVVAIAFFYSVSISYLVSTFLLFLPPLFLSALWLGFTCLQIVISFGRRAGEFGFVIGWFFLPFTGAYYPIEVLPQWAQTFSKLLPMSYVFQGMRGYVMYGADPADYLIKSYALSIPYALIAIAVFFYCFNRAKRRGLVRLMD